MLIDKVVVNQDRAAGCEAINRIFQQLFGLALAVRMEDIREKNEVEFLPAETGRQSVAPDQLDPFPACRVGVQLSGGRKGLGEIQQDRTRFRPHSAKGPAPRSRAPAQVEDPARAQVADPVELLQRFASLDPGLDIHGPHIVENPSIICVRRFVHRPLIGTQPLANSRCEPLPVRDQVAPVAKKIARIAPAAGSQVSSGQGAVFESALILDNDPERHKRRKQSSQRVEVASASRRQFLGQTWALGEPSADFQIQGGKQDFGVPIRGCQVFQELKVLPGGVGFLMEKFHAGFC